MCAGSMLANRELYLLYMRLIAHFKIDPVPAKDGCDGIDVVDCHPVSGNCDPTSLVAIPRPYKVLFVPRDLDFIGMSVA